jgi:hypothetical protein
MEPEGSLPHSQKPATCPYPEPYKFYSLPLQINITALSSSVFMIRFDFDQWSI